MISRIIDEKAIVKAKGLIEQAEHIVAICHTAPDGDAIGSCLAATHVFSAIGKDIRTVIPDSHLFNLRDLPGAIDIVDATKYYDFAVKLLTDADLILCLDFNEPKRCGRLEKALCDSKAHKILIDHHLNPNIEADVIISHPEVAATAYLFFRFLCRLEFFNLIDKKAAECVLAGMMTDTGNFSYNCDDPDMYVVVAELIRKGADKEKLYRQLFATFSANCLRLNSYALLNKMEVYKDECAALITLSRDELNRYHYTKGDTEGLVNKPLSIPGIVYSCFMRQEADMIKISMRSVGDFPVNELCSQYYGGGGHLNAAGGEYYGSLEDAAELFRSILKENKKRYIK
ncbi:MAG: DHH family phosphoesterase [Muribaculaceae bacterium]|nr:DHH family phosphoesterase [Muribaculaceae bacterium]